MAAFFEDQPQRVRQKARRGRVHEARLLAAVSASQEETQLAQRKPRQVTETLVSARF